MFKRSKYTYEFRLESVEAVLKGSHSLKSIAKARGIEDSNLRLWVSFYRQYGPSGLLPRVKQNYSASFKLVVLKVIEKESLSLLSACVRFNIPSASVIINWQKAFKLKGLPGLISQPKGRPKMKLPIKRKPRKSAKPLTKEEELLRENEHLKAENELLKKLHALVQTRKK